MTHERRIIKLHGELGNERVELLVRGMRADEVRGELAAAGDSILEMLAANKKIAADLEARREAAKATRRRRAS